MISKPPVTHFSIMFKSSFAQDLLQEQRQHRNLQQEILPKQLLEGGHYKSQFAASTHGPLDNVSLNFESEDNSVSRRASSKYAGGHEVSESAHHDLQTSDLGTSDFSSSELWPPSTSSSPFEYAPRYRSTSFNSDNRSNNNNVNSQQPGQSFLNLQSSMQFSYLKRVRNS